MRVAGEWVRFDEPISCHHNYVAEEQTRGVECRKDSGVIDEIPGAYKPIEKVMEQQRDLVEVVAHLKQVVCVKG